MAQNTPYGGVYANIDYDKLYGPKVWREYPKHVQTGIPGQYVAVNSKEEEDRVISKLEKKIEAYDNLPAEPLAIDPEKEILISRARELNIPINTKWSKMKLKATIEAAEQDVDDLPAEVEPEDDKDALIAKAKSLGIAANKLWGIPRLKASIAQIEEQNAE